MNSQPTFGQKNLVVEDRAIMPSSLIIELENMLNGSIEADLSNIELPISSYPSLHFGKGGLHIWISDRATNKRAAIIYYE